MPKSTPTDGSEKLMPGAELLLKALEDEGVEVVFGYPGGAVLPIYDALFKNNKIKHILVRHEQAAVTRPRAMLGQPARQVSCWSRPVRAQPMR
jgi:acetolactate synthase-1/2/3 large subunit